jgi:hypothetical protein
MNTTFVLYFVVPSLLGTGILLIGVILLAVASRSRKKSGEVEVGDWPLTGGKILTSRLDQHETRKDDKSGTHVDINYEPVVEYVYTVKDVEYRGNKVFPGESIYFSQSAAQEILDQHQQNLYVPVRYNPDDPSVSSLEKRPEGTNYFHMIGLVLTSFGILACCFTSFMTFVIMGGIR